MNLLQQKFITKLNQSVWIAKNLIVKGEQMSTREKKKMAYNDLEDHVISWCVEQLSMLRDVVADLEYDLSIPGLQKELIFKDLAKSVESLVNLISPLRHDEPCLMEWAFGFIDEYFVFADYDKELN